jgi:hypothetical protein
VGSEHSCELAALAGARLVVASEVREGSTWNEPRLKSLTGGDAITARFMRCNPFTYRPAFKLVVAGNHRPRIRNAGPAMARRLHMLPWSFTPPRPDRTLEEQLKAEAPAILRWAIDGCIEWQRIGLSPPAVVASATREYLEAEDELGAWIEERIEIDAEQALAREWFVSTAELTRYERALLMVELSPADRYVLDVFRVAGGREHARLLHPNFGPATVTGLDLVPQPKIGGDEVQMRHFRGGTPTPGWTVDWKVVDPCGLLPAEAEVHLRCRDLSTGVQAMMAETWLASKHGGADHEGWLNSLVVRRQAETAPLVSTFVAVLEPYRDQSQVRAVRRLPLHLPDGSPAGDTQVAVEVTLTDGRTDLLIAWDSASAHRELSQPEWDATTDADFAVIRRAPDGVIRRVVLHGGTFVACDPRRVTLPPGETSLETP